MSEFPSLRAYHTPTIFSDDTHSPFEDIVAEGDIADTFKGKTVLDIGSGLEGFARGLFSEFMSSDDQPNVVSLNPQFSDWRMMEDYSSGTLRSYKHYKQYDIANAMRETMELQCEDFEGYFAQRVALAGLVQKLPFKAGSFDIAVSAWAFPNCLYDCWQGGTPAEHQAGYREIFRVLKPGGVALLAPVRGWEQSHSLEQLELTNMPDGLFSIEQQAGRPFIKIEKPL